MRKQHLPTKVCLTCNRPFAWRKKWQRDWDNVKYCSYRCKQAKNKINAKDNRESSI